MKRIKTNNMKQLLIIIGITLCMMVQGQEKPEDSINMNLDTPWIVDEFIQHSRYRWYNEVKGQWIDSTLFYKNLQDQVNLRQAFIEYCYSDSHKSSSTYIVADFEGYTEWLYNLLKLKEPEYETEPGIRHNKAY